MASSSCDVDELGLLFSQLRLRISKDATNSVDRPGPVGPAVQAGTQQVSDPLLAPRRRLASLPFYGLPNELLEEIFSVTSQADLSTICRASKHLRVLAEPYLYRTISVTNKNSKKSKQITAQLIRTLRERPQLVDTTSAFCLDNSSYGDKPYDFERDMNVPTDAENRLSDIDKHLDIVVPLPHPTIRMASCLMAYSLGSKARDFPAILIMALLIMGFTNLERLELYQCNLVFAAIIDLTDRSTHRPWLGLRHWTSTLKSVTIQSQRGFSLPPSLIRIFGPLEHLDICNLHGYKPAYSGSDLNLLGSAHPSKDALRSLKLHWGFLGLHDVFVPLVDLRTLDQFSKLKSLCLNMEIFKYYRPIRPSLPESLNRIEISGLSLHQHVVDQEFFSFICAWLELGTRGESLLLLKKPVSVLPSLKSVTMRIRKDLCFCLCEGPGLIGRVKDALDALKDDRLGPSHCLGLQSLNNLKYALGHHEVHCEIVEDD